MKLETAACRNCLKETDKGIIFPAMHLARVADEHRIPRTKRTLSFNDGNKWSFLVALFKRYQEKIQRTPPRETPLELRLTMAVLSMFAISKNYGKPLRFAIPQHDLWELTTPHDAWPPNYRKRYYEYAPKALKNINKHFGEVWFDNKTAFRWIEFDKMEGDIGNVDYRITGTIYLPLLDDDGKPFRNNKIVFVDSLNHVNGYVAWKAWWLSRMMAYNVKGNQKPIKARRFTRKELSGLLCVNNNRNVEVFQKVTTDNFRLIKHKRKYPNLEKFSVVNQLS